MRMPLALTGLLMSVALSSAQTSSIESWTKAKEAPLAAVQTRFDSTVIAQATAEVGLAVSMVLSRDLADAGMPHGAPDDSTYYEQQWRTFRAVPALGRGGAEASFVSGPGVAPASALEFRDREPKAFVSIDYRLTVTVKPMLPAKRGGSPRTLVVASAQFVGIPDDGSGLLLEPVEIRSSGLIERDFFERLQARLSGR